MDPEVGDTTYNHENPAGMDTCIICCMTNLVISTVKENEGYYGSHLILTQYHISKGLKVLAKKEKRVWPLNLVSYMLEMFGSKEIK